MPRVSRETAAWILAAVLGLLVAAAITLAASRLTTQRIGLYGEPASAGRALAAPADTTTSPPRSRLPKRRPAPKRPPAAKRRVPPAHPTPAPTAPVAPHGERDGDD